MYPLPENLARDLEPWRLPTGRIERVLLMSLPSVMTMGDDYLSDGHSFHLGLAYLAAVLRENGLTVGILDCFAEDREHIRPSKGDGWIERGLSDQDILDRVRAFAPQLIGITVPFSCQHYVAHEVSRLIKSVFPAMLIVAGGNHVTAVPGQIDRGCFDYLVLGEGEYAFLQLIQALNQGEPVNHIPSVYVAGRSEYDCQRHIERLDDLPLPALDLLPLQKLWSSGRRWINMVATRGCVYNCNFCSIHTVMGRRIRKRSIDNVLAEIKHWKRTFGIQEIYFEDDNLTTDQRWAKALFRGIVAAKLGIRFYARNGIRADSIDRELLTLMKAAGFHDFMIAPESGSQRTLDVIIGKKMKLEDCTRAVRLAREVGIGINAFFVIGFPEETWADIQATAQYAHTLKALGCVGFWVSLAAPYPGTRLFEQCQTAGLIPKSLDYRTLRTVDYLIDNPNYSAAEIKDFRDRLMRDLAPARLSLGQKAWKGLSLLARDPSFFWMKVRYKLSAIR
jgi:anaerobic magnesium-protoporphyrin IX monomethyl ester cyclase